MEFFEQAHVPKGGESSKKDSKSEETVKKQLKQMLYGYKKRDNELIKSSVDIKLDCDESSSVSGFSDLNLTISSGADDTTRATIGSPDDIDSILDDVQGDSSTKLSDPVITSDDERLSISQESMSRDVSIESEELLNTELSSSLELVTSDEVGSLISDSLISHTLSETETSQEFDCDGLLASKIREKLKIKIEAPKQAHKRKLEKVEAKSEECVSQKVKSKSKSKKKKDPIGPSVLHPSLLDESPHQSTGTGVTEVPVLSPPYISIKVANMPQECFNDVLGEYKHATFRNISSDKLMSEKSSSSYLDTIMTIDVIDMAEEITDITKTDEYCINEVDKSQETEKITDTDLRQEFLADDSIISIDDAQRSGDIPEDFENDVLEESIKLIFKENVCVCIMKHPAKMYVHGKFKVRSLGGTTEVFGHILTEQTNEIYAPYCNFAQCLSTIENNCSYYGLFSKLTTLGLNVVEAEDIVTTLGEYDGVLVLEPLKSVKINFVEEYFTIASLFSKSSKHIVDNCHAEALERLGCSIYLNQPRKVFEVPISWQEINKYCFKEQSRGILCGGKGVGKSTCLRYQVNRLLAAGTVLVIDLDIGQSEFTVAGNISATIVNEPLLGPNFTHLRKPERTLNLGMINALDDMRRYVNAIIELIAHCASDERLRAMRWLVNTMGLCNDVGLHFITAIILHCQPTYLLQIDSKNAKKRFDMFLRPQLVAAHYDLYRNMRLFADTACPDNLNYGFILTHHTESPVRNNNSIAPRDERYLNFLAYFGELLSFHRVSSLLAILPYEVQLQDLCVYMNVKIPEGTVSQVLNGKIVALCQHKPGSVTKKTYVLADKPILCHGHGLIRGIDFETGILYLITPIPIESLQLVDTLLYADWVPELRGQETHLLAGVAVPYRMPTMHQQKQLMFTPRRRFNPVQLLKMSRGS